MSVADMRASRSTLLALAVAIVSALGLGAPLGAASLLGILDLQTASGQRIEPLAVGTNKAVVLLFISTDCPISNAYAPEVNRIAAEYGPRGVAVRLVYADGDVTPASAKKHLADFRYTMTAVLDPEQKLAARLGAKVTPEAFVVSGAGTTVYRGRIDDLYPALGKRRSQPTERDLRNALDAFLAGRPVAKPVTDAVGCYLPPLKKP